MIRKMVLASSALAFGLLGLRAQTIPVSFSQRMVERLQSEALDHPSDALVRAQLAEALLVRARETGDKALLQESLRQIDAGLKLEPTNYLLERARTEWLVDNGYFAEALILATKLNRAMPDDLLTYSLLVRIYLKQGNVEEAKRQAQWMLDIRQAEAISLWRAAEVREAVGDTAGSLQFLADAYRSTQSEHEFDRAVIRAQSARLLARAGRSDDAAKTATDDRRQFPGSTEISALLSGIAE